MPAVARQRGSTGASLSGKGASGVRRVIGSRPSTPFATSTRTMEPAVMAWCAAAVAMTFDEPGTGRASHVPTGLNVLFP